MPAPAFSLADIRTIRRQHARGQLDVRAWADARECSIETIRRIARRDTYRHVPDILESALSTEPLPAEAADALAAASRAAADQTPQAPEVLGLLEELRKKDAP